MPAAGFTLIRDKIVINKAVTDTLLADTANLVAAGKVPAGCPLYLIAREIVHKEHFQWKVSGHPIVLICDTYDGHQGRIVTTPPPAATGAKGAKGAKGTGVKGPKIAGGPGGNGGNGADGATSAPITLYARNAVKGMLYTLGGQGGDGGAGGAGGDGILIPLPANPGPTGPGAPIRQGTNGGKGGNGGNGGKPGNGGAITIRYVTGEIKTIGAFSVAAGKGGAAGAGGKRGEGTKAMPGKNGPPGTAGAPGPAPGKNGVVTQTAVAAKDWPVQVAGQLPALALQAWADHRERVGEYEFRRWVPGQPAAAGTVSHRDRAIAEFEAVLKLRPDSPRAQRFLTYLKLGLTPLGLPYNLDLRPKVTLFEQFMVDYNSHREALFNGLGSFLSQAGQVNTQKGFAQTQANFYASHVAVANTEVEIAELDANQAQQRLDYLESRRKALEDKLKALNTAEGDMDFFGFFLGVVEVVTAVAGIVGAAFTAGASLAATVAAVGALATTAESMSTHLTDLVDLKDPTDPHLNKNGKALVGDLKEVVEQGKKFVEGARAVHDLINAQLKDDPEAPQPQVLAEQVQLAFDASMSRFDLERAALAKQGAQQKKQAYQNGQTELTALIAGMSQNQKKLTDIARLLLRQFQIYNDLFIRYHFYVNRAYDLYLLPVQEKTRATRFDFGYVHPDEEADVFAALDRNEPNVASKVTTLVGKYVESLDGVLPVDARDEFIQYTNSKLDAVGKVWSITSPTVLASLRTTGSAIFDTALDDVDADHTELKIQYVTVALLGAQAKNPIDKVFDAWLTHAGGAANRRHGDKVPFTTPAPPIRDAINVELEPIDTDDLEVELIDPAAEPRAWGRSPITRWRIHLSTQSAQNLDLAGLSAIQLGVRYAFYAPQVSPLKKLGPVPRRASSKKATVTPEPV